MTLRASPTVKPNNSEAVIWRSVAAIVLKGLQLLLSALVVLVIGIDRSIQRSRIGENGPRHLDARYRSCEMLTSFWPLPRLAGRMRSAEVVCR